MRWPVGCGWSVRWVIWGGVRPARESRPFRRLWWTIPPRRPSGVLAEFVPDAKQAMEWVTGRVCLVDGTITPCWSDAAHRKLWSRKHGTTGFTAQLVSLLDGSAVSIFDPLPGKTHDATAFTETPVAKIVEHTGGGIGDKGHQGLPGNGHPRKKPPGGELSKTDNESNAEISALRAPIERLVAHFKSWRIFHTDYPDLCQLSAHRRRGQMICSRASRSSEGRGSGGEGLGAGADGDGAVAAGGADVAVRSPRSIRRFRAC
jgi:hypothetical protein